MWLFSATIRCCSCAKNCAAKPPQSAADRSTIGFNSGERERRVLSHLIADRANPSKRSPPGGNPGWVQALQMAARPPARRMLRDAAAVVNVARFPIGTGRVNSAARRGVANRTDLPIGDASQVGHRVEVLLP